MKNIFGPAIATSPHPKIKNPTAVVAAIGIIAPP
jgi:hypothetical protein